MRRQVDWWHIGCVVLFVLGGPLAWWGIIAGVVEVIKLLVR